MVLNAGWAQYGPFVDLSYSEVETQVNINALHPIYLLKVLLNQITSRSKKSGIVIVSSGLGTFPVPGFLTYSCSKSFVNYLGIGLNYELKEKVDVISF